MSPTGCSITLLVVKPHKKISAFLLVPFFYFFFWTLNKTWQAIVFLLLSFHLFLILSSRVYCFRPKILGFFITNSKFHNSSKDCMYIYSYLYYSSICICHFQVVLHNWLLFEAHMRITRVSFASKNKMNNSNGLEKIIHS